MKILLVGGGNLLYHLAKNLAARGHFVTIINKNAAHARELARKLKATIICGEASDPRILEDAGAYECDILVALTNKDQDNLFICKMGKKYYNIDKTTALVNDPENEELFKQLGIDSIFNTTHLLSSLIEQNVAVDDFNNLIFLEEGNLNITQYVIPENASVVGRTLKEVDLPLSIVLGGIIRSGRVVIPRGRTELKAGDKLLIISLPEDQAEAIKILGGEEE